MRKVDIMRTSASRPEFLKISTEALQKHLIAKDIEFRWLIHEDCLNKQLSNQCMKYIEECGLYTAIKLNNPAIGQGASLTWLIKQVNTKYVINFEDDFEAIQDINVNQLIELMDNNPDINQIAFHKRNIMPQKPGFKKIQIVRDGITLVTNPHWAFTPSMFRLSYLKPKWINFKLEPHWKMNERLKSTKGLRNAEWVMKNTGTYFLGQIKNKKLLKEHGGNMEKEEYDKINGGHMAYHLGQGRSRRENSY